ncbi:OmpA family protein [Azospirillum melinis]|uniref:OmpA family protein n=1 Tax=Azospirillum melinis TaxID=328839 RepID=A0ABX2KG89_9PROT|nr:OmpA family protein [Azospirillum melinis]MBP2304962.1 outer membrane protein OmpA-like peptidoglycan-associated protein [Azospirillum melinis]NUA99649.1 OmpA family protein [Azospirillum melinis]
MHAGLFHAQFEATVRGPNNAAMRRSRITVRRRSRNAAKRLVLALGACVWVTLPVAGLAQGLPGPATPMGPNPSECEIQAALLGTTGPNCPPVAMQRPAAPPPAMPSVAPPGQRPGPVTVPPLPGPTAMQAPELRAAFRVEFDFNSAVIRPESREILDKVAAVMGTAGTTRFRIVGHTDAVGGDAANLALSKRRAAAAVEYLVSRHRIHADRLEASGMGARELLLPDQPKAAANRRVEIVNLGG